MRPGSSKRRSSSARKRRASKLVDVTLSHAGGNDLLLRTAAGPSAARHSTATDGSPTRPFPEVSGRDVALHSSMFASKEERELDNLLMFPATAITAPSAAASTIICGTQRATAVRSPFNPALCPVDTFDSWLTSVVVSIPPATASSKSIKSGAMPQISQQVRRNFLQRESQLQKAVEQLQRGIDILERALYEANYRRQVLSAYYQAIEEDIENGSSMLHRDSAYHLRLRQDNRSEHHVRYSDNQNDINARLDKLYYVMERLEAIEGVTEDREENVEKLQNKRLMMSMMSPLGDTAQSAQSQFNLTSVNMLIGATNMDEDDEAYISRMEALRPSHSTADKEKQAAARFARRALWTMARKAKKLENELQLPRAPADITSRLRNELILSFSARVLALKEPNTASSTYVLPDIATGPLPDSRQFTSRDGDDQVESFVEWYVNEVVDPFAMSQLLQIVPQECLVTTACRLVYACDVNRPLQISQALPDLSKVLLQAVKEGRQEAFAQLSLSTSVSYLTSLAKPSTSMTMYYAALLAGQLDALERLLSLGFFHTQALHVLLFMQADWHDPVLETYLQQQLDRVEQGLTMNTKHRLHRGSSAFRSHTGSVLAEGYNSPRGIGLDPGSNHSDDNDRFTDAHLEAMEDALREAIAFVSSNLGMARHQASSGSFRLVGEGEPHSSMVMEGGKQTRPSVYEAEPQDNETPEAPVNALVGSVQRLRLILQARNLGLSQLLLNDVQNGANKVAGNLHHAFLKSALDALNGPNQRSTAPAPTEFDDCLDDNTFSHLLQSTSLDAVVSQPLTCTMAPAFSTPLLRRIDPWSYAPGSTTRTPLLIRADTFVDVVRATQSVECAYSSETAAEDAVENADESSSSTRRAEPLKSFKDCFYYEAHVSLDYLLLIGEQQWSTNPLHDPLHSADDEGSVRSVALSSTTSSQMSAGSTTTSNTEQQANQLVVGWCTETIAGFANGCCQGNSGVCLGATSDGFGVSFSLMYSRDLLEDNTYDEIVLQVWRHHNGKVTRLTMSTAAAPPVCLRVIRRKPGATYGGKHDDDNEGGPRNSLSSSTIHEDRLGDMTDDGTESMLLAGRCILFPEVRLLAEGELETVRPRFTALSTAAGDNDEDDEETQELQSQSPEAVMDRLRQEANFSEEAELDGVSLYGTDALAVGFLYDPKHDAATLFINGLSLGVAFKGFGASLACTSLYPAATLMATRDVAQKLSLPSPYSTPATIIDIGTVNDNNNNNTRAAEQQPQHLAIVRFAFDEDSLVFFHGVPNELDLRTKLERRVRQRTVGSPSELQPNNKRHVMFNTSPSISSEVYQIRLPRLIDRDYKFSCLLSIFGLAGTGKSTAGVPTDEDHHGGGFGASGAGSTSRGSIMKSRRQRRTVSAADDEAEDVKSVLEPMSAAHHVAGFRLQQLLNQPSRGGLHDLLFYPPLYIRRRSDDEENNAGLQLGGVVIIPEGARLTPLGAALAVRQQAMAYALASHPGTEFFDFSIDAVKSRRMTFLAACSLGYADVAQVLLERMPLHELLDYFGIRVQHDELVKLKQDHTMRHHTFSQQQASHQQQRSRTGKGAVTENVASGRYVTNALSVAALSPQVMYNVQPSDGTPLHCALLGGNHTPVITVLLNFLYHVLIKSNKKKFSDNPIGIGEYLEDENVLDARTDAAQQGDVLLKEAINASSRAGESALFMAVRFSNIEIAKRLLGLGANPVCMDRISRAYSLEVACANNCPSIALALLDQDAYANSAVLLNHSGVATPLCWCALNNIADVTVALLKHGVDPSIGLEDNTPLLLATTFGSEAAALALLDGSEVVKSDAPRHGDHASRPTLNVDAADPRTQCTPLHLACELGQIEVVKKLLQHGASLNVASKPNNYTPLHTAIVNNQEAVAMRILEYAKDKLRRGSCALDVCAIDHNGDTTLHLAARQGMVDVLEYLLVQFSQHEMQRLSKLRNFGKEPPSVPYHIHNNHGRNALMLAIQSGEIQAAQTLIALVPEDADCPGGPLVEGTCVSLLHATSNGLDEVVLSMLTQPDQYAASAAFRETFMSSYNARREELDAKETEATTQNPATKAPAAQIGKGLHLLVVRTGNMRRRQHRQPTTSYHDALMARTRTQTRRKGHRSRGPTRRRKDDRVDSIATAENSTTAINNKNSKVVSASPLDKLKDRCRSSEEGGGGGEGGKFQSTIRKRSSYVRVLLARGRQDASPAAALEHLLRGFALPEIYIMVEDVGLESTVVGIQNISAMMYGEAIMGYLQEHADMVIAPSRLVHFCRDVKARADSLLQSGHSLPHWYTRRDEIRKVMSKAPPLCQDLARMIRLYGRTNNSARALDEMQAIVNTFESRMTSRVGCFQRQSSPSSQIDDITSKTTSPAKAEVTRKYVYREEQLCTPFNYSLLQLATTLGLPAIVQFILNTFHVDPMFVPQRHRHVMDEGRSGSLFRSARHSVAASESSASAASPTHTGHALVWDVEPCTCICDADGDTDAKWLWTPYRLAVRALHPATVQVLLRRSASHSTEPLHIKANPSGAVLDVDMKEPASVDTTQRTALQEVIAIHLGEAVPRHLAGGANGAHNGGRATSVVGEPGSGGRTATVISLARLLLHHGAAVRGKYDADGMDAWLLAATAGDLACNLLMGEQAPMLCPSSLTQDAAETPTPEAVDENKQLLAQWKKQGYGIDEARIDMSAGGSNGEAVHFEVAHAFDTPPLRLPEDMSAADEDHMRRAYMSFLLFAVADHNPQTLLPLLRRYPDAFQSTAVHPITGDTLLTLMLRKARNRLILLGDALTDEEIADMLPKDANEQQQQQRVPNNNDEEDGAAGAANESTSSSEAKAANRKNGIFRDPFSIPEVRNILKIAMRLIMKHMSPESLYHYTVDNETALSLAARIGAMPLISLIVCSPSVDMGSAGSSHGSWQPVPKAVLRRSSRSSPCTRTHSRRGSGTSYSSRTPDIDVDCRPLLIDNLASTAVRTMLASVVYYSEEDARVIDTLLDCILNTDERIDFLRCVYPNIHAIPGLRLAAQYVHAARIFLAPPPCTNAFWANLLYAQYIGALNDLPIQSQTWSVLLHTLLPGAPTVPIYLMQKGVLSMDEDGHNHRGCGGDARSSRSLLGASSNTTAPGAQSGGNRRRHKSGSRRKPAPKKRRVNSWQFITRRTGIFLQLMAFSAADSLMPVRAPRRGASKEKKEKGGEGKGKKKQPMAAAPLEEGPKGLTDTLLLDVIELAVRFDNVEVFDTLTGLRLPESAFANINPNNSSSGAVDVKGSAMTSTILACSSSLAGALTPQQAEIILHKMRDLFWKDLIETKKVDLQAVAAGSVSLLRHLFKDVPEAKQYLSYLRYDRIDALSGRPEGLTILQPEKNNERPHLTLAVMDDVVPAASARSTQPPPRKGPKVVDFSLNDVSGRSALTRMPSDASIGGGSTAGSEEDDLADDSEDVIFAKSCYGLSSLGAATEARKDVTTITWGIGAAAKSVGLNRRDHAVVQFVEDAAGKKSPSAENTPVVAATPPILAPLPPPVSLPVSTTAAAAIAASSKSKAGGASGTRRRSLDALAKSVQRRESHTSVKSSSAPSASDTGNALVVAPTAPPPKWFMYLQDDWAMHTALVLQSPHPAVNAVEVIEFLLENRAALSLSVLQLFLAASQPSNRWFTRSGDLLTLSYQTQTHADTLLHLLVIHDQCQLAEYFLALCLFYFSQLRYDEPNPSPGRFTVREIRDLRDRENDDDNDHEFDAGPLKQPVNFLRLMLRRNRHGLTPFDYVRSAGMMQLLQLYGCVPPSYRPNPRSFTRTLGLKNQVDSNTAALRLLSASPDRSFFPVPRLILASENFTALQDGNNAEKIDRAAGLPDNDRANGRRYQRAKLALFNLVTTGVSSAPTSAGTRRGGSARARGGEQSNFPGVPGVSDAALLRNLLASQRVTGSYVLPILLNEDVSLLHLGLCRFDDELVNSYGRTASSTMMPLSSSISKVSSQEISLTCMPASIDNLLNTSDVNEQLTLTPYAQSLLPVLHQSSHLAEDGTTVVHHSRNSITGQLPAITGGQLSSSDKQNHNNRVTSAGRSRNNNNNAKGAAATTGNTNNNAAASGPKMSLRDIIKALKSRQFVVYPLSLPTSAAAPSGPTEGPQASSGRKKGKAADVSSTVKAGGGNLFLNKVMAAHNTDAEDVVEESENANEAAMLVSMTPMQLALSAGFMKTVQAATKGAQAEQYKSVAKVVRPVSSKQPKAGIAGSQLIRANSGAPGARAPPASAPTTTIVSQPVFNIPPFMVGDPVVLAGGAPAIAARLDEWVLVQRDRLRRSREALLTGVADATLAAKPKKRTGGKSGGRAASKPRVPERKATASSMRSSLFNGTAASSQPTADDDGAASATNGPTSLVDSAKPVGGVSTAEQQALMRLLVRQFSSCAGAKLSRDMGLSVGPNYDVDDVGDALAVVRALKASNSKGATNL